MESSFNTHCIGDDRIEIECVGYKENSVPVKSNGSEVTKYLHEKYSGNRRFVFWDVEDGICELVHHKGVFEKIRTLRVREDCYEEKDSYGL